MHDSLFFFLNSLGGMHTTYELTDGDLIDIRLTSHLNITMQDCLGEVTHCQDSTYLSAAGCGGVQSRRAVEAGCLLKCCATSNTPVPLQQAWPFSPRIWAD